MRATRAKESWCLWQTLAVRLPGGSLLLPFALHLDPFFYDSGSASQSVLGTAT